MYHASVCGLSSGCVDYPSGCIYHLRVLFPFCPKFLFLYPLVFFTSFFFFFSFSHFHFIFSITTFTHVPRPNSQETDQQGPESVTDSGIRPGWRPWSHLPELAILSLLLKTVFLEVVRTPLGALWLGAVSATSWALSEHCVS